MGIIKFVKKIRRKIIYKKYIVHDINEIINYSCAFSEDEAKSRIERDILVYSHIVEKGIAHKKFKVFFGKEFVALLSKYVCDYRKYEIKDEYIYNVGLSALDKYILFNKINGVDEIDFVKRPGGDILTEDFIGINEISVSEFYKNTESDFNLFSGSRKSVRLYDEKSDKINQEEICNIVELAKNAPSACNRQAVRVHIIQQEEIIKKICEIQEGCKGFGTNAGALLVVTSDLNYYLPLERKIPMFDCGIFAMNLLYSIHYNKLAACILNGSMTKEKDNEIKKILDIKDNEMIASVIVMYKLNKDSNVRVGVTKRREVKDICTFH